MFLDSLYAWPPTLFLGSGRRGIIYTGMENMKHLMAFEEVGLRNLLSPGGQDPLEKMVKHAAGKDWSVSRHNNGWSMTRPSKGVDELAEVQILVGQQSGRIEAQVVLRPPQPRSKRMKGLSLLLRSRPINVEHAGDVVTVRRWAADDRSVCVRETVPSDDSARDWLADTAARDWESLFSHLMEEVDRNERKHLRNTSRINRFFMNRSQFESALRPVMSATTGYAFEKSESHQLSKGIRVLDPTMRFTFDIPDLNLLVGSEKHLLVDRQALNIIRCMAIGCRRISADHPESNLMLYLQDKAAWVVAKHPDPRTVRRWGSAEYLPDSFVELHDLSREMSVDPLSGFSRDTGGSVPSGFNLRFSFQTVVTHIKESARVADPMLIARSAPDRDALKVLEQAVDICEGIKASHEGHRVDLWVTGGRIMVEVRLEVDATWQDTTVAEQSQDEGDL